MKRRLLGLLLSTCVVLTLAFLSTGGAFADAKTLENSMVTGNFTDTFTYNESGQEPTITVKDGETTLTEGTDYMVSYTPVTPAAGAILDPKLDSTGKPLNAGTYTVTITGTGNYTGTVTKEFKINKADGFANFSDHLNSGTLYYTGSEQPLFELYSASGVVEYLVGDSASPEGNYTQGIPQKKEVGTYYVLYKVKENNNYTAKGENAGNITIAPVKVVIKVKNQTMAVGGELPGNEYEKKAKSNDAAVEDGLAYFHFSGTATYEYWKDGAKVDNPDTTKVGTYTIKYTEGLYSSDNDYKIDGYENGTLYIKKPVAIPTASTQTYTYTGSAQTYVFGNAGGSEDYNVTNNTRTDVGTQEVNVSLKNTTDTMWSDRTTDDKTFTFTINEAKKYGGSSKSSSKKNDTNATDTEKKDTDATGTDTKDTETAEETAAKVEAAKTGASSASAKARSEKTSKGNIKVVFKPDTKAQRFVDEMKAQGYTVKYRFYRSTKKSSDYKSMLTKSTKTYINTVGKEGTRYYYKAQVRVYDGSGKLIAKTELKQCKYATRVF